jgi:hypothetical protein
MVLQSCQVMWDADTDMDMLQVDGQQSTWGIVCGVCVGVGGGGDSANGSVLGPLPETCRPRFNALSSRANSRLNLGIF